MSFDQEPRRDRLQSPVSTSSFSYFLLKTVFLKILSLNEETVICMGFTKSLRRHSAI